jgi:glycosyltransferase involved in cell wall biosynthesis
LGLALDSLKGQTRQIDEIIVVNDCSPETDRIEAVLQRYPQVVYIRNERNLGLAASRNVGLKAAAGEVVSFLDADDELHPQKIEFQLRVFRPEIAVTCQARRIGDSREPAETVRCDGEFEVREVTESDSIVRRNSLTGAALMISKDLLLRFGGYDESLRSCEDFDLWLRLLDGGVSVADIRLPLYLYRYNESGLSRNNLNVSRWELQVLRKYFERHGRAFLATRADARLWAFWLLKHILRFERCGDKELRLEVRRNIGLLSDYPVLSILLACTDRFRLMRPVVAFADMRGAWSRRLACIRHKG